MRRINLSITLVVGLLFSMTAAMPAVWAQTSSKAPQAPAVDPTGAIPAAQVAAQATEVTTLLVELTSKFAPRADIEAIVPRFFQVRHTMAGESGETERTLQGQPTIESLQALQGKWQSWQQQMAAWLDLLTKRSIELQGALNRLDNLQTQWTRTRASAHASGEPGATLDQIETVLNAIAAGQVALRARHDRLLNLQSRISEEAKRCSDILARIAQRQKGEVAGILTRESAPLWSPAAWQTTWVRFPRRFRDLTETFRLDWGPYGRDPANEMPLHLVLLLVTAGLFMAVRRRLKDWEVDAAKGESMAAVFQQPIAAALYITWFVATRYDSPTPPMVRETLSALAIVPILRLVQPVIPPRLLTAVYGVGALYGLDILRGVLSGTAGIEQVLLMVEGAAGIAILYRLRASGELERIVFQDPDRSRKVLPVIIRVVAAGLIVGLAAGFIGYMRLGRIVTAGIIFSFALALALYAGVRVFGGIAAVCLRFWPLRHLHMVRQRGDLLEKWIYRILLGLAILSWAVRVLEHLGLLNPVQTVIRAFLDTRLERGTISISLEDILAFVAAVAVASLLSRLIRFALQEEVYPRAHVHSGSAYAVSRLLHYTILALGFVVGLGLLGMDLTRVSVMAGALGVGIGFGLQNVVNNFVCGLILLFERPVHVGDIIDVGNLFGEVRRIGFRASTVRTRQGADIIIPNAEFITARVTNWTLSDRLRRIDLPVSVNYASQPKQVIEVLEEVARAHSRVLSFPVPCCFFMKYGDSSIDFELRVWTDQSIDYVQIRSELNAAVYDAVKAAGMSFPFPQREVRLLENSNGDPVEKKKKGQG